MLNFQELTLKEFLTDYWQKKPLFIPKALPHFKNPISPEELAGFALEEEFESRIVMQDLKKSSQWQLKTGPFSRKDFKNLPTSHWTLLVQGVDRLIPELSVLLDDFNFIPQWRIDDLMISYAVEQGSVGPHFDHYDVFLYQAQGRRKWLLTTSDCREDNYLPNLELRIMKEFKIEQEYILEEGDMLYLPAQVGHYGISLSQDCMTYSIGYRSYKDQELWDGFGDYLASKPRSSSYYQDPSWSELRETSELPQQAWQKAKELLKKLLDNDALIQDWFGCFATQLDSHAESLRSLNCDDERLESKEQFKQQLKHSSGFLRNPLSRFAYYKQGETLVLYLDGNQYGIDKVSQDLVEKIANHRRLQLKDLIQYLGQIENERFLYELWQLQILEFIE